MGAAEDLVKRFAFDAGFGAKRQRFKDADEGHADEGLKRGLDGLAHARRFAHVENLPAHRLQRIPMGIKDRLLGRCHQSQTAAVGAGLATADRAVDQTDVAVGQGRVKLAHLRWFNGGRDNDGGAWRQGAHQALLAGDDLKNLLAIHDHHKNSLDRPGQICQAVDAFAAQFHQHLTAFSPQIKADHCKAGLDQIFCHADAHIAQADDANVFHYQPLFRW